MVKPWLCVHELVGSSLGRDVWFTNVLFRRSLGHHRLSYGIRALGETIGGQLAVESDQVLMEKPEVH